MKNSTAGYGAAMQWVVVLAALGMGCNYNRQSASVLNPYEEGDFAKAAVNACTLADKAPKRDRLVLRLEQGAVLRAAGLLQASNAAFDQADQMAASFDDEADLKASQEAMAAMVNQTAFDYRGYAYDRVMLNTYKALNCLEMGDWEGARVELRRAYERQKQAVEKYAKKIDADGKVRDEKKKEYDVDRAMEDSKFQQGLENEYSELEVADLSAYKNYVNPFTEYLHGLYLMAAGVDSSDMEQAATAMRRVAGMVKNNYIAQDAVLAEKVASGSQIPKLTYVFFETGLAPERDEIRIDIPVFIYNIAVHDTRVDYVGASFPKLKKRDCRFDQLMVQTTGGSYPTELLCDMDKVVAQEFKNEMPIVITRTLISTAVKAAAAYGAAEATKKNQWANIATRIGTTVYQATANQADLRTWKSLPKRICVARFSTPADRQIRLDLPGSAPTRIELEDAVVNVVYVKAVSDAAPPSVRQFKLK